ncbi:MAG: class I SAM-dependent methyltransferase [Candidatus Binatia bacterium]|nr:class I SAM-dependent methyltransferase [Candidatus Binatia bacterium]MDG1958092.1 class I SAM-dependent methyltransferase [Candidatus Binatia bacterium]MDG2011208.1 class I SAM-dependent methyltransferase [Candidatus Binatia bacterium]
MGFYETKVLPGMLDFAMRQPPIMKQRGKVVPRARGRVLEIGMGSGLNLGFYDPDRVEIVLGLEPSAELKGLAADRVREAPVPVEMVGLIGEDIPLEEDSVDTVLITYTMCTIPGVEEALSEMRRVLRPQGELLFSEHGRAPDANIARWQRFVEPLWKRMAGGCHLTRDVPELLRSAGFELAELDQLYLPGPRLATFNTWGVATPA